MSRQWSVIVAAALTLGVVGCGESQDSVEPRDAAFALDALPSADSTVPAQRLAPATTALDAPDPYSGPEGSQLLDGSESQVLESCQDRALTIRSENQSKSIEGDVTAAVLPTETGGLALVVYLDGVLVAGGCVDAPTAEYLRQHDGGVYALTPLSDGVVVGIASQNPLRNSPLLTQVDGPVVLAAGTSGNAAAFVVSRDASLGLAESETSGSLDLLIDRAMTEGTVMFGGIDIPR